MAKLWVLKILCSGTILLLAASCIEPYEAATQEFESVLVVDAFITDELRNQQIKLSRTFRLEQDSAVSETNANVKVLANGHTINFSEVSPGKYVSDSPFKAELGTDYSLSVQTGNGHSYASQPVQLRNHAQIDSLYAERITNDFGDDGMAIFVDSYDPSGTSRFYRFEYEESFKIVAPRWNPMNFQIVDNEDVGETTVVYARSGAESLILAPRTEEARVCYGSDFSRSFIITRTDDSEEDRLVRFGVRFVDRDNYKLAHRYSILVRQFTISEKAYEYYETLNKLSSLESVFSEIQPGFFKGNVYAEDDDSERVLGYFDISSMNEKRIFFDYEDYFPNERLPSYAVQCKAIKPITLMESFRLNLVAYSDPGVNGDSPEFIAINRACADCTALGSNVKPAFWVD